MPKGLNIPFEVIVNLAAIDYPFEYKRGIALKGFSTLLIATTKWGVDPGTAVQWHFEESKDHISLSKYTGDRTHYI